MSGGRARAVAFLCALAAGTAACSDPNAPAEAVAFQGVSAGGQHSCAITVSGATYCWGRGGAGELGDGAYESSVLPRRIALDTAFASISAGYRHTCGLTIEGALYCWGWNFSGQIGNGTTVDQAVPVIVETALEFVRVSSGASHTCGLAASGTAYCWGANDQGQLGDGTTTSRTVPTRVSGPRMVEISAGGFHTCGLGVDGTAYCWGLNHQGQLGTGATVARPAPAAVAGDLTFRALDAGFTHTCGITDAAEAWCWGSNAQGELGVAGTTWPGTPGSTTPVAVYGEERFVQVDAGLDFTCAVAVTSRARCWGRGFEGQLGNGSLMSWTTPQPVAEIDDFVFVTAGGDTHACGYTRANAVFCWGRGESGQLGNPVTRVSALPVRVAGVRRQD